MDKKLLKQRTNKLLAQSVTISTDHLSILKQCDSRQDFFSTKNNIRKKKNNISLYKHSETLVNRFLSPNHRFEPPNFIDQIKNTMTTMDDDHMILKFSKKKAIKKTINEQNNREDKPRLSQPIRVKFCQINTNTSTKQFSGISKTDKINIDHFKIIEKLGQGTYSQVYKAIHIKTNSIYALKVLSKKRMRTLKVQQNLFRQIKLQQFLNHPNLVQLYGYFHDQENVYLICQICTDGNSYSLLNRVKMNTKKKHLSVDQTAKIITQLCQGVNNMHKNHIMHRDIKPQNLMMTMGTSAKLGDLGWAIYNPNNQLRKTICGTPLYLAPQLINQVEYTQAVDIWAIGILTYQFLTGEIPFHVKDIRELSRIVSQQVDYNLIQDPTAKDFILQILNKDSEKRSNIQELLHHQFLSKIRLSKNYL